MDKDATLKLKKNRRTLKKIYIYVLTECEINLIMQIAKQQNTGI